MRIAVENVSKSYGRFRALDAVSLDIHDGELLALLGPSGSGKTTLLRIISGMERADEGGRVFFGDEDVTDRPIGRRGVGFVFQHYALFRHMTVLENVAFGLRVRPRRLRPPRSEIRRRALELIDLVQLSSMAGRYPSQLSGGQRQRVALARALAVEPRVLLLDEPFGALDARVRAELRAWLRRLHEEIGVTSVFVTHDQDEALELADRVAVMNAGRIEQLGTPNEVFHEPRTEFVMNFLGRVNLFHGRADGSRVRLGTAELAHEGPAVGDVRVFVRPHELDLLPDGSAGTLGAVVHRIHAAGAAVRLDLRLDSGEMLVAELPADRHEAMGLREGERVGVLPRRVRVFGGEPAAA